jgi:shikimate dehydrogenase
MSKKVYYGLIGKTLKHSFSPSYFAEKFKKEGIKNHFYKNYELEKVADFKKKLPKDIRGFNVTMPFKKSIIPFLDKLSPEAKKIQAVNTVKVTSDGLHGYNSDVYGFDTSLGNFIGNKKIDRAMVLGNGGSAKAVHYVLRNKNIPFTIISRKRGYRGYKNLDAEFMKKHRLIINTTPLGSLPQKDTAPEIPYQYLSSRHLLFDLVYNPQKTLFLTRGEEQGAAIINGLEMLHLQAEKSWKIWNSR